MSGIGHNGGPAFPYYSPVHGAAQEGMSLRDWFAGHALLATQINAWDDDMTVDANARVAAIWAYAIADAMLAARDATND